MMLTALLLAVLMTDADPQPAVAKRFLGWLAGADRSVASLIGILGPELEPSRPRDLGFAIQRISISGDGQWLGVEAVILDGQVIYVSSNEAAGSVKRELDRPKLLRHLTATTGAKRMDVPADLLVPYELLFFPYDEFSVGSRCGWAALPPQGKREIDQLVRAGRFDLIENIVRGGNPEGRVYAARALDGRELSSATQRAVEAVFASPLPIRHCSSDLIRSSPAADLRRR
jgi:hypothetical protein